MQFGRSFFFGFRDHLNLSYSPLRASPFGITKYHKNNVCSKPLLGLYFSNCVWIFQEKSLSGPPSKSIGGPKSTKRRKQNNKIISGYECPAILKTTRFDNVARSTEGLTFQQIAARPKHDAELSWIPNCRELAKNF